MCDNLDEEQEEHLKIEGNKREKENRHNLNLNEKEQLRIYEKKGKKATCDDSKTKKNRDNFDNNEKEQLRKYDKKRKMDKRLQTLDERNSMFNNVQMCSMVDPSILTTPVFRLKNITNLLFRKVLLTFVIFVGKSNFEGVLLN